jgi:glutaredoxin
MNDCPYCKELKERLTEDKIAFVEINTDLKENEEEYNKISKVAESDMVPLVLIGNQILVPESSFNTIKEAVDITKNLLKS